jgi:hypothetical protein
MKKWGKQLPLYFKTIKQNEMKNLIFILLFLVVLVEKSTAQTNYVIINGTLYVLTPATTSTTNSEQQTPAVNNAGWLNSNNQQQNGFYNQQNFLQSNLNQPYYYADNQTVYERNMRLQNMRLGLQFANDFINIFGNGYNVAGQIFNNTKESFQPVQFTA